MAHIEWNRVTWYSKILAVVLFVILVCSAFCFGVWYDKQASPQSSNAYKVAVFGGEVPSNWNVFLQLSSDIATSTDALTHAAYLYASIAPEPIEFGDGAFDQVDFYLIDAHTKQQLITGRSGVSTTTIGHMPVTMIQYRTDNGEIDKNGTGGRDYIVQSYVNPNTFLLITDWSQGDDDFESSLQHFLKTIDLRNIQ